MKQRLAQNVKRLVDIVGATTGLAVLSPLLGVAYILVRADVGTPVIFSQLRPGLQGKPFYIRKFRTMREPRPGENQYRTDGSRLTRFGRFLRRSSIDELPELWNVLVGEMSLVGPRPLLMEYLDKYTPLQNRRHEVRPGITGWAQVNGRQTAKFSRRLEFDVWYVDNWSLALDVKILALTVVNVFRSSGVIPGQNVDDVDDLGFNKA